MARQAPKKDLVDQIRAELNRCRPYWGLLSKHSDGALNYRWMAAFANGTIRDPGMRRMIALGKYIGFRITSEPAPHFLKFKPE